MSLTNDRFSANTRLGDRSHDTGVHQKWYKHRIANQIETESQLTPRPFSHLTAQTHNARRHEREFSTQPRIFKTTAGMPIGAFEKDDVNYERRAFGLHNTKSPNRIFRSKDEHDDMFRHHSGYHIHLTPVAHDKISSYSHAVHTDPRYGMTQSRQGTYKSDNKLM